MAIYLGSRLCHRYATSRRRFSGRETGYRFMDALGQIANQIGAQTDKKLALFASDDSDGRSFYSAAPAFKQMGLDVIGFDKELGIAPATTTILRP